jgi:hypothetical protein
MQHLPERLFVLKEPPSLWGDYGYILTQGMAERTPDKSLLLYRTGPFIPPISFPSLTPVVLQIVRDQLEPHAFTGFEFRRVSKRRIVRLDWRNWDLSAKTPPELPETGEPEDYILRGKHSVATARELGDIWEMYIPPTPGLQISGGSDFDPAKYCGQDICKMCDLGGYTYVSPRLRDWLQSNYPDWVRFQPANPSGDA